MDFEEDEYLKYHKNQIIEDLKITDKKPVVKYGEDAREFANKHKKRIKINKETSGVFLYEDLPEEYEETGVVCLLKYSIGSLAHELCHAKQFQENNKWFNRSLILDIVYMISYYYYPPEREAFNYAKEYLKRKRLDNELVEYRRKIRNNAIASCCKISVVLGFLLSILLIIYIDIK